ncbi:polysaccharide biosynthesis C-terminal domain-containing protein [Frisingicoccus sp.]|uniref:polysaccharide biosynthesis C-terminal domain-containing protein n=1 Tax=Frisingicoccus sp. TaxID=1918627 RepID=UPI003AB535F7
MQITTFFVDATPEILEIAPGIVRIYFLSFLQMGVNIQATYYLQSVMRTKWSNILALLRGLIFSGALVYLLPIWWGIDGVWWAMTITEFVVVIFSIICLRTADKAGMQGLGA